jgi:Cu(I)/Ag(I) efflux system membrane protein CusA/SilA
LPEGVQIIPTYDRSGIIHRAIATLREKLVEESIVVALVCIVFLWHVRSALVAIITLPIAIILSFVPLFLLGQTSNIMSLGGIAIAIGAMIDAAIIMVENGHKALERFREEHQRDPDPKERAELLISAAKAAGRPLFFSLLVITVSFIPVFPVNGSRGPPLQASGVHQDVRDVFRLLARHHPRARADDLLYPRQDHARREKPG